MYSRKEIEQSLSDMGIKHGDVVLVRAAPRKVGAIDGGVATILAALKGTVGESGTVVTLGFTKIYPMHKVAQSPVFDSKTPSNAGSLAKAFMSDPGCLRSTHPSNSFLAVGPEAEYILRDHDASSLSYEPMNKLREVGAKMLLIGCVADSPGFTTVHSAQENLGLTRKGWLRGLMGVRYADDGQTYTYRKKDFGGCSRGFSKFYKYYVQEEILITGRIGDAYSIMANAKDAYEIEYEKIKRDNKFYLCDNPDCFSCKVTWRNNVVGIPVYFASILWKLLKR